VFCWDEETGFVEEETTLEDCGFMDAFVNVLLLLLLLLLEGESGGVVVMMGSGLLSFTEIKRFPEFERSKLLPLFRRILDPDRLNRGEETDRFSLKASTPKQVIFLLLSCVTHFRKYSIDQNSKNSTWRTLFIG
jgi:hypothetical protein